MRKHARKDLNHDEIVQAFRRIGWSVTTLHQLGGGVPDLLVGGSVNGVKHNLLIEVKSEDGAVRDCQEVWHSTWRGEVPLVVRTVEDVWRIAGIEPHIEQNISQNVTPVITVSSLMSMSKDDKKPIKRNKFHKGRNNQGR